MRIEYKTSTFFSGNYSNDVFSLSRNVIFYGF